MRRPPFPPLFALAFLFALSSTAMAEKILTITSEPSGATIEINGRGAGVTPYQEKVKEFWFNGPKYLWSEFLNTPLQLTVSKEGYVPQTITITTGPYRWVNANNTAEKIFYVIKQQSFHVVLRKAAAQGPFPLTVNSEPPGAEIHVDGRFDSSTPSKLMLMLGQHTIMVVRPGFKPWQRVINIEAEAEKTVNALLESEGPNAGPPSVPGAWSPAAPAHTASGQKPELVVGSGHSSGVYSLAFSPDGKLLASGDSEGVIKLWDGRSGAALRTLTETGMLTQGEPSVRALAFSPDGRVLISATVTRFDSKENVVGWKTDIILWDVTSGKPLVSLQGLDGRYTSLAFSPDGSVLAGGKIDNPLTLGEAEGGVTLWDVKGGREVAKLPSPTDVSVLMFTPDGKQLLAGNWASGHRLWTLPGGRYKEMDGLPIMRNRSQQNSTADLNPYAKQFVVATGSTRNIVTRTLSQNVVSVFDASGTRLLKDLKWDRDDQWVTAVKFSPSGKSLACADIGGRVKVWDTETWAETASVSAGQSSAAIAMSRNSKVLAFSTEGGKAIKLWDLGEETTMKIFGGDAGHTDEITALAFSPDSRILASASDDKMVKLWDVESGRVKTLSGHTTGVIEVAFSHDGKTLVTVATYDEGEDELDKGIRFWDVASGAAQKTVTPSSPPLSLGFSPDGAMLAVGNIDKTISLYDPASGRLLRTLSGLSGEVDSVMFINPQMLQSFNTDDVGDKFEFRLWNATTGELLKTVKEEDEGDPNSAIFLGNMGGGLAVSDKLYAYPLPGGGFHLFSKSSSQMMDFSLRSEVAKLYLFNDDDWLISTPEGLFDGSPGGWKRAHWRFNENTFDNSGLELYFNEFFYPNLLQEIIAGKSPKPRGGRDLGQTDRRQPSVLIFEVNGEVNPGSDKRRAAGLRTDKRMASVTITVTDNLGAPKRSDHGASSGAHDLRLFRNGTLIRVWRDDLFQLGEKDGCEQLAPSSPGAPRRVRCRAEVTVVAGENEFSAYAFNGQKVKSEDSFYNVGGADTLRRDRTLYVLTVGVGQYENPEFNLKYTVKDAQDFGAEVRRQQEAVGFYQRIEVIALLDRGARKDFILSALKTLAEAAQPEDGLIIYFSGHGVARGERFYLLPSDIGYKGPRSALDDAATQTVLAHSISDLELELALTGIDAGRILLIIDACHSGKALQADDERRGPMNTSGLGQLAYEKGMYVLTASQDAEMAYESAALKHSYLTYALVEEGLKLKVGEADADADGQLLLSEWLNYAKRRVPRLRQEQTVGGTPRPNKSLEEVGAVEGGVVQRPKVFYRREPELQPFVVAKLGARAPTQNAKEGTR